MLVPQTVFAPLDVSADEQARLASLLSADERERAGRFVFERDRRRYTVARATLRRLLGERIGADPAGLVFRYGATGKPSIDAPLHFNVSHSDELALYAFAEDGPVGCDLEQMRPLADLEAIVSRWFAPPECELILRAADREDLFYRYWTLKEAVLKGLGTGITLLSCDFALRAEGERFRAEGPGALPEWVAVPHAAPAGFRAAVAVKTP